MLRKYLNTSEPNIGMFINLYIQNEKKNLPVVQTSPGHFPGEVHFSPELKIFTCVSINLFSRPLRSI